MEVGDRNHIKFPRERLCHDFQSWYLECKCLLSYFSEFQCPRERERKAKIQHNPKEGLFFFPFPVESSCQFNLSQNTVSDEHD